MVRVRLSLERQEDRVGVCTFYPFLAQLTAGTVKNCRMNGIRYKCENNVQPTHSLGVAPGCRKSRTSKSETCATHVWRPSWTLGRGKVSLFEFQRCRYYLDRHGRVVGTNCDMA